MSSQHNSHNYCKTFYFVLSREFALEGHALDSEWAFRKQKLIVKRVQICTEVRLFKRSCSK